MTDHHEELQQAANIICNVLTRLGTHMKTTAVPGHFEAEAAAAQLHNQAIQTGILMEIYTTLRGERSVIADAQRDYIQRNASNEVDALKKLVD